MDLPRPAGATVRLTQPFGCAGKPACRENLALLSLRYRCALQFAM